MEANQIPPAFSPCGFSWPLIVCLMFTLWVLGTTHSELLSDPDTYLHISIGRWILEHHTFPSVDVFSYTKLGEPWIAHEWLAGVMLAAVHQYAGWTGLVSLASLALGATLAYLMRYLLGRMEPIHALLFTALAGAALKAHLLARPHVLAWLLLAIWVGQLMRSVENQERPPLWLLAIMVLWANLHGGFTLGLALAGAFSLEAIFSAPRPARWTIAKPWLGFLLASLLAAMITPSGWKGIWFTVQVMNLKHLESILEWMPPKTVVLWFLEGWLFLLLGLAVAGRLKMSLWRLLPLLGLAHLALAHMRNVPVFALLAPFLIATPLARQWYADAQQARQAETLDRLFRSLTPRAQWPAILLVGLLLAGAAAVLSRNERYQPEAKITPDKALQAARAAKITGRVFNGYGFGGFLVFSGIPVFIDGRADLYGDRLLERHFHALDANQPEKLPRLVDEYRVNWTLLQAGSPTASRLDSLPGWRRIYADKIAVVHARSPAPAGKP